MKRRHKVMAIVAAFAMLSPALAGACVNYTPMTSPPPPMSPPGTPPTPIPVPAWVKKPETGKRQVLVNTNGFFMGTDVCVCGLGISTAMMGPAAPMMASVEFVISNTATGTNRPVNAGGAEFGPFLPDADVAMSLEAIDPTKSYFGFKSDGPISFDFADPSNQLGQNEVFRAKFTVMGQESDLNKFFGGGSWLGAGFGSEGGSHQIQAVQKLEVVPLPAAIPLMLTALGALAATALRRRAAT